MFLFSERKAETLSYLNQLKHDESKRVLMGGGGGGLPLTVDG